MMALLRTLRNIGNCEEVKLKYFTFEKILHYAALRSENDRVMFFAHD